MNKKEPLFELIKSLTMSEKRHFDVSSRLHQPGGENNYLYLYREIIKFDVCFDFELQEKIKGRIKKKDYAFTKSYLYKMLLKSLNTFHKERISIDSALNELLLSIEILHKKALYKQAQKLCVKGIKQAKKYGKQELLLIFEKWKYILNEKTQNPYIKNYYPKTNQILGEISNTLEYKEIYDRIFDYVILLGAAKEEKEKEVLKRIVNSPLLKFEKNAISIEAKMYFNNANGLYYYFIKEFKKSITFYSKSIALFDQNIEFKKCNPEKYISCFNNYTINQAHLGDTLALKESINYLKEYVLTLKNESLKISTLSTLLSLELSYYTANDFREGGIALKGIVTIQKKYQEKFNKAHHVFVSYFISYLYFGAGNFKESLVWITKIMNQPKTNTREDIFVFARILLLITHYELGNFNFLEYQLRSIKTFLSKKERNYEYEKVTIDLLKDLVLSKRNEQEVFNSYKPFFEVYLGKENDLLDYFDILAWITSKTTPVLFEESHRNHISEKMKLVNTF